MNGWLDEALVGLALAAGFGYAAYSLGPKSFRRWLLSHLGLEAKSGGSCGGCDGCESAKSEATEIRIPVSKIGRRP